VFIFVCIQGSCSLSRALVRPEGGTKSKKETREEEGQTSLCVYACETRQGWKLVSLPLAVTFVEFIRERVKVVYHSLYIVGMHTDERSGRW
jgi:hypothetical protein